MANRILEASVIGLLAMVSGLPAGAASKHAIDARRTPRVVSASPSSESLPGRVVDDGLVEIYSNLSQFYPLGRYWCCTAYGIENPFAVAVPFTPSFDATVTKVRIAVSASGGNDTITVSIHEDAGGLPGNVLQSFELSDLPFFGTCCEVAASSANVPVSAGSQYWIAIAPSDETSEATWNWNVTNQTTQPFAFFNAGIWQPTTGILGGVSVRGTK
jgi:hypothetical protein